MSSFQSRIDEYGFERDEEFDFKTYEEFMSEYLRVLARRAAKWQKMLHGRNPITKRVKVKRYIRKGIPSEHRAQVWLEVSGAKHKMEKYPEVYPRLLNGPHEVALVESIKTDLHRTFPENIHFQSGGQDIKRNQLYNVLVAFSHHNPDIGYCQGLNYLAGFMLLILHDEHAAFWLLNRLVKKVLPDYYRKDLIGLKADQEVLEDLIHMKMPCLLEHMQGLGMSLSIPTTKWLICLFIDVLPVETILRIWDCMFYEGSKILFRVCLTLIMMHQEAIMKCQDFPSICNTFKTMTKDASTINCHTFMEHCFELPGSLPMRQIRSLRAQARKELEGDQKL